MKKTNPYCKALGIPVPRLEAAKESPDANYYSLLIVALLERGEPITLEEAARRFEQAGVAPAESALASLKRCKPGRPPIYRDGRLYALDPSDDETDLWAFRLGLRPPQATPLRIVRPDPASLPSPDEPLRVESLNEAWRDDVPSTWSAQRIAICVLDAHGGTMRPDVVIAFVRARSEWRRLSKDNAKYWRCGAPIRVLAEGLWELDRAHDAVRSARKAVRERIAMVRRWAQMRPDPAVIEANHRRFERERRAHADRLARMRRVLVHAFPVKAPKALVLVDVAKREITSLVGEEITRAKARLADYDVIAAAEVRALLRALGFEPGERRIEELGPPQKTMQINRSGRTLKITKGLLAQGSCGIGRPFGDEKALRGYLRGGGLTKLRRRLEADAKSLFSLYSYGRLHGAVRIRWGFLDEMIPAPWHHRDEETIHDLVRQSLALGVPMEIVAGTAPGWSDPWSRVQRVRAVKDENGWRYWLLDEHGYEIDIEDVQLARLLERRDGDE